MLKYTYRYLFDESVPTQELEDNFKLAFFTVECLHGSSRVRLGCYFNRDETLRIYEIDASTDIGSDLALIFIGFVTKEHGDRSVEIECLPPSI